ncbi:MAG: DNA recombination protein RmuC [Cyclobacteriaceae bacterium]|nr:DNA recombination protein RmuC [Cyclobacteriaceae bacterium]
MTYDWLYLLGGLVVGGLAAFFATRFYMLNHRVLTRAEKEMFDRQLQDLGVNKRILEEKNESLVMQHETLKKDLDGERQNSLELNRQLASIQSDYRNLLEKLETQKKEVERLQEKFTVEFKNLANEILEEKSKKFTDQNKLNLGEILNPLKEKIMEFEKKVELTNKENIERNTSLKEQIISLKELNLKITKDAENLTRALKGESKTQGSWGEFILESILEKSGLIKGREYFVQESFSTETGRLQPDVIIKLPDQKNIIIDSKVSLVAYEKYCSAEDDIDRPRLLQDHIISVRKHTRELSLKNYQQLYDIGSLDFVLLFMPIEPAFGLAVQHDDQLFVDAYEKNIVIVSPTTLIATLRTISSIWRQEYQNRNAMEIARQGGMLYDKFKLFTDDLVKVGDNLELTRKSYAAAMNKLSEGKDNLIRKTERLKELGAKVSKNMDQRLLDRSAE